LRWQADVSVPCALPSEDIDLSRPGVYELPHWGGHFVVSAHDGPGVAWADLRRVQARARGGGERFQVAPQRPPRALKKQFQQQGIPEWQRHGPLLWRADELLFVPGLGIDARAWAAPGIDRATIAWHGPGGPGDASVA
jgi:tRNA(Ile)-lysidine synthase